MREPVAPPRPWMPAVWEHDAQGLPVRHRPGRRHGDLWVSRCPDQAFLFDFPALREVMPLRPCVLCLELEDSP